jgi:hypothetical protein
MEKMLKEERGEDFSKVIANSDGCCSNEHILDILYQKLYMSFQCMLEISA